MTFGDLAYALALAPLTADGIAIDGQRVASYVAAFESGTPHAGTNTLDDQIPL
jgi:hypothetical protein